jgi:hypothetical protein
MKIVVYMLVIAILFAGGCSSGRVESHSRAGYNFSTIDKVAIVAVEGTLRSEAAKNQIADLFAMELLKKGYAPKERAGVAALLREQGFQASELITEAGAAEAGKILNVPAVLVVNVPHFGDEIFISAKMVDIEDGSVLWLGSGSGKIGGFGSLWGAGAADSSEENALFGGIGIAGGVLGGAENLPLSPQEIERAQRIIRRMCSTLPSRLSTEW